MLTMHNQQQQQQQQHIKLTTPLTIYENEIKNKKSKRSHKHKSSNHQENENYSKLETHKKEHLLTINKNDFDDNDEESLNLLRARINTISRKHLLNVFSSGYERTNQSVNDGKILNQDHHFHHHHHQQYNNSSSFLNKLKSIKLLPDLNNNFLTYLYIFVKLLYLLSSIGQVLILNRLIGNNFYMLGINLITSFFFEQEWPHLAIFPRISLCEIYIRFVFYFSYLLRSSKRVLKEIRK